MEITVNSPEKKYVSRGGFKLEHALAAFSADVRGKICLDVGASAGGFTDCLLKRGAARVYAVDVGTAQMAQSLRDDERVTAAENTDIRGYSPFEEIEVITVDVSFISVGKIAADLARIAGAGCELIVLVKPQFEAGIGRVGKRGVVRDERTRKKAVAGVSEALTAAGFTVKGMTESPISGGDGNVEYFLYGVKDEIQ
jgi:23S rRNA (cytidine1920-2'-O)/16S rRNA (cytidine1409-2'-O)-methyltransferase